MALAKVCISHSRVLLLPIAYFGYTPRGAKQSPWMYTIYFSLPVEILYSSTGKPVKATKSDAFHSLWMLLHTFVFYMLFLSFLCMDYLPFGSTVAKRFDERASLLDYLDPRHIGNCFFLGLWFQQILAWGAAIVEFVVQV